VRTRPRYGTFMSRMALRGLGDVRETRRHPSLVAVLASFARTSVFRKHDVDLPEDEAKLQTIVLFCQAWSVAQG